MSEESVAQNTDYDRIAEAIAFLDEHRLEQPELADVADHLGLSRSHTQRMFSRWAGVSPKRFLQYLTKEHARDLLRRSESVLVTTYETGLSSPSRLHELLVACEAVTPGELKSKGSGLEIRYGVHASPFGECVIAVTDRGICGLHFLAGREPNTVLARERRRFEAAEWREAPGRTAEWVDRVFTAWDRAEMHGGAAAADEPRERRPSGVRGTSDHEPLPLMLAGTNFQIQVWQALLRIPPGSAVPYKRVAEYVGRPSAARAVANAVGSNPIGYLIPCHRVIRSTGAFGGYQSGTERKRAMLAREGARKESNST